MAKQTIRQPRKATPKAIPTDSKTAPENTARPIVTLQDKLIRRHSSLPATKDSDRKPEKAQGEPEEETTKAVEAFLATLTPFQKSAYARQERFLAAFPEHPSIRATCRYLGEFIRSTVSHWITLDMYGFKARYMTAQREALEALEAQCDKRILDQKPGDSPILMIVRLKKLAHNVGDNGYEQNVTIVNEDATQRRKELHELATAYAKRPPEDK